MTLTGPSGHPCSIWSHSVIGDVSIAPFGCGSNDSEYNHQLQ
uniref:Uncharacterized protein n=1 Tax=Yersinia enterocolitica W22703 TaxID=913028 RepID=F4MYG2_YEREN|nr:unknown protein [Yersinia enterocolitica W22703]